MRRLRLPATDRGRELMTIALVLAFVIPVAVAAVRALPDGQFYQRWFTPAVMLSCGHGFTEVPAAAQPPQLRSFLAVRSRTLDCRMVRGLPRAPITGFQNGARWLLTATAIVW